MTPYFREFRDLRKKSRNLKEHYHFTSGWKMALGTSPRGSVHKAKISCLSLEFYSKARANNVIKLFLMYTNSLQVQKK